MTIVITSEEARELALAGKLQPNTTVDGYLDLADTKITSLPKGLNVQGDLVLEGTPLTSLPEGLKVGGHLRLEWTEITSLPEDLVVGKSVFGSNKEMKVPKGIEYCLPFP